MAENMGSTIKKVKRALGTKDYDLERLMKNVEADFMDLSHKIDLASRLAQSYDLEANNRKKR